MQDTDCSPSSVPFDRRAFLTRGAAGLSAAWLTAQWPSMVSAATHAHAATASPNKAKFEFLTPEEAVEIEAMAARIIPSDETPGAKEAGVIYFIDRALVTFATDSQKTYREGLPEVQAFVTEKFPGVKKFSAASPEQQDAVLESLSESKAKITASRRNRPNANAQPFFDTLRYHTIAGFLIDPDSDRRGNRGGVGWKVIGREPEHMFQPPFGALDKDYPGWQPVSAEKK
jgi:gluconate 2-dehydrogenase gamma chain